MLHPAAPQIRDSEVFIIAAAGYEELLWPWQSLQPGDIVTFEKEFKDPRAADHSAVVDHVAGGEIWLRSKDVTNSIFVHKFTKDVATDWFYMKFGQEKLRYFRPTRKTLGL